MMEGARRRPALWAMLACLAVLAMMLVPVRGARAEAETEAMEIVTSEHPLIDPKPVTHVQTQDDLFNILLLGIDFGAKHYWGSGQKRVLENCHTDAVLVVSINRTKNTVSLVSLPRDTLTYVPGVKGLYRLNAAINCADTVEEGIRHTMDSASWLLGGIEIDRYCAVDMSSMIALGDALGGVDFEMDMDYIGHSGRHYTKGMQHLDGQGIMDYVRARTNATVEYNDIGRTRRQRTMMTAIFAKLRQEGAEKIGELFGMLEGGKNIFTDLSMLDLTALMPLALGIDAQSIGSYVITGRYRASLSGWNLTYTDQDNRIAVLGEVYGIDAEPLRFVSFEHAQFLENDGFELVRFIALTRGLIAECEAVEDATPEQIDSLQSLIKAHNDAVAAFDLAGEALNSLSLTRMRNVRRLLREQADATAAAFGVTKITWSRQSRFCYDPLINEYNEINWR